MTSNDFYFLFFCSPVVFAGSNKEKLSPDRFQGEPLNKLLHTDNAVESMIKIPFSIFDIIILQISSANSCSF